MEKTNEYTNRAAEDIEDIRSVLDGDTERFSRIVSRYKNLVFDLVYRTSIRPEEADDLAQEVFVRVFASLDRFDLSRNFHTWLYTLALNHIRNSNRRHRRRNYMERPTERPDSIPSAGGGDHGARVIYEDEISDLVSSLLAKLKEKYRVPLVLHYFQDMDVRQVGKILGLPANTVKTRLKRGREQMEKLLAERPEFETGPVNSGIL